MFEKLFFQCRYVVFFDNLFTWQRISSPSSIDASRAVVNKGLLNRINRSNRVGMGMGMGHGAWVPWVVGFMGSLGGIVVWVY